MSISGTVCLAQSFIGMLLRSTLAIIMTVVVYYERGLVMKLEELHTGLQRYIKIGQECSTTTRISGER